MFACLARKKVRKKERKKNKKKNTDRQTDKRTDRKTDRKTDNETWKRKRTDRKRLRVPSDGVSPSSTGELAPRRSLRHLPHEDRRCGAFRDL